MRPFKHSVFVLVLACAAYPACRGHLPPTEPPPSIEDDPSTRTNDAPAGPLAGAVSPLPGDNGSNGGTNALPLPPPSGGSGGSLPTP